METFDIRLWSDKDINKNFPKTYSYIMKCKNQGKNMFNII